MDYIRSMIRCKSIVYLLCNPRWSEGRSVNLEKVIIIRGGQTSSPLCLSVEFPKKVTMDKKLRYYVSVFLLRRPIQFYKPKVVFE